MDISNGLYRTTTAHPNADIPAGKLVFVGENETGPFVVVPHYNENNRWYWREPVTPLTESFASTLRRLPQEGFYTLPEALTFENGGKWLKNAIVQLGYDRDGNGIIFVGERREAMEENALFFSDRGHRIKDDLLGKLVWAPILPVRQVSGGPQVH